MIYKNINLYGLMSFDKQDYGSILKMIKKSRGYISYIDRENNNGIRNPRYENYVKLKQAAYTKAKMYNNSEDNVTRFYAFIGDGTVSPEKIDVFLEKHGILEDYEYEYSLTHQNEDSYVATHEAIPTEHSSFYSALEIDDNLERIDRQYLKKDFVLNNFQRFVLPPFTGKYKNSLVKPQIIANIYDVGMITIQLSIGYFQQQSEIPIQEPNDLVFNNVNYYKKLNNYSSKDFWEKVNIGDATIYEIMNYYFSFLKKLCEGIKITEEKNKQLAWVFGDINYDNNSSEPHKKYIEKNKKLYVSHLVNSPKDIIDKMTTQNLNDILDENSVLELKPMHLYCTEPIALLSFSSNSYKDEILNQMEKYKDDSITEEVKKEIFELTSRNYIELDMFEFLRLYELTFIKKYYSLQLLENLSKKSFHSLKEFNEVKRDLNFLKLNYDEQNLFKSYGSPMKIYTKLLKNTGTDKVLHKVEGMFSDARDDAKNYRETINNQTETTILIVTSILTIIFGYNGIKLIVYDILSNLPFIGYIFMNHQLRWAVGFWLILLSVVIWLNYRRFKVTRL